VVYKVLIDNRVLTAQRMTGWERATDEISKRVVGVRSNLQIEATTIELASRYKQISSDWITIPRLCKRYDLVHFPAFPPAPSVSKKISTLYNIWDLTWWHYPETSSSFGKHYFKVLAEKYFNSGNHILTASNTMKQDIVDLFGVKESKIHVANLGVSNCKCGSRTEKIDKPYLLAVGTIEPRKNYEMLVEAFHKSKASARYDLKIVGRKGWGANSRLPSEFVGAVSEAELHTLYRNCAAFLLPSRYEGFGLPVLEAFMHGKPVYCSNLRIFHELFNDMPTYISPDAIDDWVSALDDLDFSNPFIEKNYQFSQNFTWQKTADSVANIYANILASDN